MTAATKMSLAINVREPGLLPLEQVPESDAKYGHINIPRFGRHLLFSPHPDHAGRRVEWVPEWVARYMIDRFNRRTAHFEIAHDLLQSKNVDSLRNQVRATLAEVMREHWFLHEIATIARQAAGLPAPEPEAGASAIEPPTTNKPAPSALYVARSDRPLVGRKPKPAKHEPEPEPETTRTEAPEPVAE